MDDLKPQAREWARRNDLEVDFEKRSIRIGGIHDDVIYVRFGALALHQFRDAFARRCRRRWYYGWERVLIN
jgi:hypothetical protein